MPLNINSLNLSSGRTLDNGGASRSGPEFQRILEKAIDGKSLSQSDLWMWEMAKDVKPRPMRGPDSVQMAGMLQGFEPSFSELPEELGAKLREKWSTSRSIAEKYNYFVGFSSTFMGSAMQGTAQAWSGNWRESIKVISSFMTNSGTDFQDNEHIVKFLNDLL